MYCRYRVKPVKIDSLVHDKRKIYMYVFAKRFDWKSCLSD